MNMIDYAYIACVASLLVVWIAPGGVLEKVFSALVIYCLCMICGRLFDILKDK